jgi:hypothetical protein
VLYPIPSDRERRVLFAWLKQASSLPAWCRISTYHQVFLDEVRTAYEAEQRTPGMALTIPTDWYTRCLDSHDALNVAVARLQRGDRRCFTYLGARGHFNEGLLAVSWWQDMYAGWNYGRNGFDPAGSPHWPVIERAMHDCLAAVSDVSVVLQERFLDVPAPVYSLAALLAEPHSSLVRSLVARALPAVPFAVPEVVVASGQNVPYFGMWEPVYAARRSVTFVHSYSSDLDVSVDYELEGCMNYLHGDSPAPTLAFPDDTPRREGKPTLWRLVWRDERYGQAPMPVDERDYVFVRPVPGEMLFRYG